MNTVLTRVAAGASAAVFMVSGIAAAQNVKEVKIQAERVINEKVIAHITGGGKIIELTLSYRVSFADLDITSLAQPARKLDPNTRAQRPATRYAPRKQPQRRWVRCARWWPRLSRQRAMPRGSVRARPCAKRRTVRERRHY
jgi:hypothetical protein